MNWIPSGGFPNSSNVDLLSLMPAPAASLAWSISLKNWMPFVAMSDFRRLMVSSKPYALLTRTTPSADSALDLTAGASISAAAAVAPDRRRNFALVNMGSSLCCCQLARDCANFGIRVPRSDSRQNYHCALDPIADAYERRRRKGATADASAIGGPRKRNSLGARALSRSGH
jgi:hypothetical protein